MFMCIELMTVGAMSGLGKTMEASVITVVLTAMRIPLANYIGKYGSGFEWSLVGFIHFQHFKGDCIFHLLYEAAERYTRRERIVVTGS